MTSEVTSGPATADTSPMAEITQKESADTRAGKRVRRIALSALVLFLATATLSVTSLALFTDTESVTGNAFSTGTIDLVATPATAVVTMPLMAPGDQVTAPLNIDNAGTLELRYSMTSTTTENVLASELVLTIKSGVTTCDDANWTADGTTLYNGILGSTATVAAFGSSAPGADPGDRTLAAGTNEDLCVNVTLPLSTTVGQGATTVATFTFDAEQTKNNP